MATSLDAEAGAGIFRDNQPWRISNQGVGTMNLIELSRALKQLRLGGMAATLETRLRQAQSEPLAPIDLLFLSGVGRVDTSW
jgi:hypothetical protein